VARLVRAWYVDPITPEKETAMARGTVKGMLDSLSDPDSHFLDPGEKKLLDDASSGRFHGIGAILSLRSENNNGLATARIVVISAMPGSPAATAGLKPGDSITHVDGKWVISYNPFTTPEITKATKAWLNREITDTEFKKISNDALDKRKNGITIADSLELLSAKDKGEISMTVDRPGENTPVEFKKVALGLTRVDPVSTKVLGHGIQYVRISQFNTNAATQFSARLNAALKSGAKPKAIVIDLRDNPGGQIDAAKKISSKLTGGGLFATIQEKGRKTAIRTEKTHGLGLPVVVLVNGGTANVAELVASDLKDNAGASIVGTKTFGDGLAQTPLTLKDGSEAVLTTGKLLTSKGYDFNGKGLNPSTLVSDDKRHGDAQLSEAEKILVKKLGRA
jgi:carboxyl-terminal processing protease